MPKRIWFNRTFTTAYHYVDRIRNNPDRQPFTIYTSHPKYHSLMLQAGDYSEVEPKLNMNDYADYCLDFCRKHEIDLFIPHYGLDVIAEHAAAFEEQGIKVMLGGDAHQLKIVSDKGELFNAMAQVEGVTLPDYYIVHSLSQFLDAYEQLRAKGHKVCFKPVHGEGGAGFWIVNEERKTLRSLYEFVTPQLHIEEVIRLLSEQDQFEPLMVMEYMRGPEYSIDCLGTRDQLLAAVPRKKVEGRVRALEHNEELIQLAHQIHKHIPLQYNFNVQVMYQDGVPKLLELNPRMSGGLYMSCLSGIDFPYLAVKLLLNQPFEVPTPEYDILVSHVEKEVTIQALPEQHEGGAYYK